MSARTVHACATELIELGPLPSKDEGRTQLARLCHEIDTPLSVANTAASLLPQLFNQLRSHLQDVPLTSAQAAALGSQFDAWRDIQSLLDGGLQRSIDLLRQARQSERIGGVGQTRNWLNLRSCVLDAVRFPLARFAGRVLECRVDLPPDLLVFSDAGAWQQILTNLVNNSVLHGFAGREAGQMWVDLLPTADAWLRLRYRDDGVGLAPGVQTHLFKKRVSTRAEQGSTGLGLSIIQDLVHERLGGRVHLPTPAAGIGLELVIEFPLSPP